MKKERFVVSPSGVLQSFLREGTSGARAGCREMVALPSYVSLTPRLTPLGSPWTRVQYPHAPLSLA
jgi:hypothetical protein